MHRSSFRITLVSIVLLTTACLCGGLTDLFPGGTNSGAEPGDEANEGPAAPEAAPTYDLSATENWLVVYAGGDSDIYVYDLRTRFAQLTRGPYI